VVVEDEVPEFEDISKETEELEIDLVESKGEEEKDIICLSR